MLRWVGLCARLFVGGVWLWAGVVKVGEPEASVSAVRAYQLLPPGLADVVGRVLPMFEIVLGGCLVIGLLTRLAGGVSALVLIGFIIGMSSVWARGISINCGCFGDGGPDPDAFGRYPWEIGRDVGLFVLSVFIAWLRRTPFALDNVLFATLPEGSHVEERS